MSNSQGVEVIQSLVQIEGLPKLFDILYHFLAENGYMPRIRTLDESSRTTEQYKNSSEDQSNCNNANWQPRGVQVAHTLLSLCVYPESTAHLAVSGKHHIPLASGSTSTGQFQCLSDATHTTGCENDVKPEASSAALAPTAVPTAPSFPPRSHSRKQMMSRISSIKEDSVSDQEPIIMITVPDDFEKTLGNEQPDDPSDSRPSPLHSASTSRQERRRSAIDSPTAHNLEICIGKMEDRSLKSVSFSTHATSEESSSEESQEDEPLMPSQPLSLASQLRNGIMGFYSRSSSSPTVRAPRTSNASVNISQTNTQRSLSMLSHNLQRMMPFHTSENQKEQNLNAGGMRLPSKNKKLDRDNSLAEENPKKLARLRSIKKRKTLHEISESVVRKHVMLGLAASVQEEAQEEIKLQETPPRWWLSHPGSLGHKFWDAFMTANLIFVLIGGPVMVSFELEAFKQPNWAWVVDNVVTIAYCLDVVANFSTGVYVPVCEKLEFQQEFVQPENTFLSDSNVNNWGEKNAFTKDETRLSYSMRDICGQYLKGWFCIDLISSIPWDRFLLEVLKRSSQAGSAPKLLKLLRLFRLAKLFKLHRLRKGMVSLQKAIGVSTVELLKMCFGVCLLCHYVACGFYFIAVMTDEYGAGTWLEAYLGSPLAVEENSDAVMYLNSIYWGFTTVTSVGYGDVLPVTAIEKCYAAFVMYLGVAVMAVITGKLAAILSTFGAQAALVQNQLHSVRMYCKYRNLPFHLRRVVFEFFDVKLRQKATCNEEEILKDMSPSLKAQVVCYIFKPVLQSVPFFRGCTELFLSELLCVMEPILFAPADIIIQKGQREFAMLVIAKGRVAVFSPEGSVIKELGMGSTIGEIGLFFGVRRTATVCSVTFCDTFKLMQDKLVKVQEMYPDMKVLMDDQAEDMFKQKMACYVCGQTGHVSVQCPTYNRYGRSKSESDRISRGSSSKSVKVTWLGSKRESLTFESPDEGNLSPTIHDLIAKSCDTSQWEAALQ